MAWSELLARMEGVTRTPETVAEYKALGRDRQSEIKDVGGFVGGYSNNGRRSDIRHRSILCLDADFASGSLWDDWLWMQGFAAAVYSTHKHTPAKPRLRLVVPLARNVTPEEYQAIGRRVAADLGIDQFDDTSYQPQRMMYWPSASQDAEYVFLYTDGPFLDPDVVLTTYHDWRDVSSWPMSSRVAAVIKKTAAKQKDPLEKGGLVGAFCRAYSIEEAIETFVPVYQPAEADRYTYTEGSTAAGVVIYEDGKFSYSFHGTDPASMQPVNAWDLVRLHLFHDLDADCAPDTPTSSRPSYKAMAKLAAGDKKVSAQLISDRVQEATGDFAEPIEANGTDWKEKLKEAEKQVQKQFEKGEVSEAQVRELQREIITTTKKLESYEKAAKETAEALEKLGDESDEAADEIEDVGKKADKAEESADDLGDTLDGSTSLGFAAVTAAATAAAVARRTCGRVGRTSFV